MSETSERLASTTTTYLVNLFFPRRSFLAWSAVRLFVLVCVGHGVGAKAQGNPEPAAYTYAVVHTYPHDPRAFTEGLVFCDGEFLESTGLNGESDLRKVEVTTGRVVKTVSLSPEYFGEGLAVIGKRAYQLTWRNHVCFVYDVATFRLEGKFEYEGEGWGLTTDGQNLVMSNGTNRITLIDPTTFRVVRTLEVTAAGKTVGRLNELEWIKGELFANVWQTDAVLRIDPVTGAVLGIINFSGLLAFEDWRPGIDVLNGIAYDPVADRLFVTGKRWPKIFEVRLVPQPPAR